MAESNKLMRDNVAKLEAIGIPTIEAQKIALQNPELVEPLIAEQMGASSMEDIQMDPRLQSAQRAALDEMTGLGQTGLGAEDRAAFNQLRRQAAGAAEAQQASTLQEMASRGMLDSGANLAAQLQAGQSQADRMSQEGDRLAASASEARRAALGQQANMASQMSAQDLGLKTNKASAADTIAQFNTQQRAATGAANQGYRIDRATQLAKLSESDSKSWRSCPSSKCSGWKSSAASSRCSASSASSNWCNIELGRNFRCSRNKVEVGKGVGSPQVAANEPANIDYGVNYQTGKNKYGNYA